MARFIYVSGEYSLGELDMFGQRINIRVTIPRKNEEGRISFLSGWIAEPNGRIRLVTPYGDN